MTEGNFWLNQIKIDEIKASIEKLLHQYIGEKLDEDTAQEIETRLEKRLKDYDYDMDIDLEENQLTIFIEAYETELIVEIKTEH